MATTPTQNAVPSESPSDLKYNAGKIDEFVTSMGWTYTDRLGNKHYTIEGLRWLAQESMAAFGYITMDSFEDGNTLTLPNQVLRFEATGEYYRWDGSFPKVVPTGSTPAAAGGIGEGAWVAVGAAAFGQSIAIVDSVKALMSVSDKAANNVRHVKGYVPGTAFGGGQFYWDGSKPKSQHNGITIFSPTVPWDGSYAGLAAFLAGTGETNTGGIGCWVRVNFPLDAIHTEWAGHDVTGSNDSTASVNACINKFGGVRSIRISPGTLKISFPTLYQYHDSANVARKTAFLISEKNNIYIYAENDVNINTDGAGEEERACFGVINCKPFRFTGFNFNQTCSNFSTGASATTFTPQENWIGFIFEGSTGRVEDMNPLASRIFCMADTGGTGAVHNGDITLDLIRTKLVTNYTFFTRFLQGIATLSNSYMEQTGRRWHTYGEDFACSDGTWFGHSLNNHFVNPISIESRVGPWGVRKGMVIRDNIKTGGGILVEIGGMSGSVASQNVSVIDCISEGSINADGTLSPHILIIGDSGDYSTSFNSIHISGNTFKGGGRAIQDYNVGLLGIEANGLVIENNNMDRSDRVTITSQAWRNTVYRNNKTHISAGNPGCIIAGQYPTIEGNDFDTTCLLSSLGYRIDGATIENNHFSNKLSTPINQIIDWDNFASMTYRNNRYVGMSGTRVFRLAADIVACGWRFADVTAGLTSYPSAIYAGKVSQAIGDIVYNSNPTTSNFDLCYVASSSSTWGKVALANP